MTKQLLWEEYIEQYPNRCYSYSQFCERYRLWCKKQNVPCGSITGRREVFSRLRRRHRADHQCRYRRDP